MGWVRLDDDFPHHPKALAAGAEGIALFVAGLCYCSKHETDGRIPKNAIPLLINGLRRPKAVAEKLVTVGFWDDEPGCFVIKNYLEYQRSKAEIESLREAKRAAGRRGGIASAVTRWGSRWTAETQAEDKHSAYRLVQPESNPHTHTHTQTHEEMPTREKMLCRKCGAETDADGYCDVCKLVTR